MAMDMRSGNPAFKDSTFLDLGSGRMRTSSREVMTLNGTVNKTGILLLLVVMTAAYAWSQVQFDAGAASETGVALRLAGGVRIAMPSGAFGLYLFGGLIGGLVFGLTTIFKKNWAPVTAPLYALSEGLFLGAISAVFNHVYNGIVLQAVLLTFGTLFALLFAYRSGFIRATEKFKSGVIAATGGIVLVYLVAIVLGFFNIQIPLIHESGRIGIGFSLFVVVIAALNLVLDFDLIETAVEQHAPKYMEWYGAFGLIVTLIWLYFEFLRLLGKLQSRN